MKELQMDPVITVKPVDNKMINILVGSEIGIIVGLLIVKMLTNPDFISGAPNNQFIATFFIIPFALFVFVVGVASMGLTFYFMAKQRFSGIYLWFYGLEVLIWAYFAYLMVLAQ